MKACEREAEIVELIRQGHWLAAASADLRAHAAACSGCGEMIQMRTGLRTMRAETMVPARLESTGVLWWRAEVRRRRAEVERLARPMRGAQVFALGMVLAAVAALAVLNGPGVWTDWGWTMIGPMLGAVVVLGGVVVYLALARE